MGIDVRARYLDAVRMPEAGTIVGIQGWRGELTRGVLAQLDRGPLVVFGALHPEHLPEVGRHYLRGEMIGRIGEYPHGSHMLHFELWRGSTRGHWAWGAPRPEDLIDPTAYLQSALRDGARAA